MSRTRVVICLGGLQVHKNVAPLPAVSTHRNVLNTQPPTDRSTVSGIRAPEDFLTSLETLNRSIFIGMGVHIETKNFSNAGSSSNRGHSRETNRCGSALIRPMKALQASKRWRIEA